VEELPKVPQMVQMAIEADIRARDLMVLHRSSPHAKSVYNTTSGIWKHPAAMAGCVLICKAMDVSHAFAFDFGWLAVSL
jgi:hypothetical protein